MIAERQSNIQVQGTLPGKSIQMGIDQAAMAHIMNVLTDLYSDPQQACIREYSTNALDAHREVGQTRPIEVKLPNAMTRNFVVRDYGVGLTMDEIESIYSQYGASTKRATNDQVGMLGLGCKSALTYTSQFTLTSVKDGKRIQVAISRDASGAGSMTVVDESPTSDPSGTEVSIPVQRYDTQSFEAKAVEFFRHWEPGQVLLNGKPVEPITGIQITPNMMVVHGGDIDKVVMGNVPYPVERGRRITSGLASGYHVVARVGIGDVNFPPSREALMYTLQTETTLRQLRADYEKSVAKAVQAKIDAAGDFREAITARSEWHKALRPNHNSSGYTFKGQPLPSYIEFGTPPPMGVQFSPDAAFTLERYRSRLDSHNRTHRLNVETVADAWLFVGMTDATWTPVKRKKLDAYFQKCQQEGVTVNPSYPYQTFPETAIVVKDKPSKEALRYIDPDRIVAWEDVASIKLVAAVKSGAVSGRLPGSYDFWNEAGHKVGVESNDIDVTKPLLWLHGNRWESRAIQEVLVKSGLMPKGFSLVYFGQNRIDKFVRTFPEAVEVRKFLVEQAAKWVKAMSPDTREAVSMRLRNTADRYLVLDEAQVNDPDIKHNIKVAKASQSNAVDTVLELRRAYRNLGVYDELDALEKHPIKAALKPYPLYNAALVKTDPEHLYQYLNAVYAWNATAATAKP